MVQASALGLSVLAACGGRGAADSGFSPEVGVLVAKPGGGFFLSDSHFGGQASRVRLLEIGWGRRVDVHDVDANGRTNPVPVLRDVVIGEGVLSDGFDLELDTNAITHVTRLIVRRPHDSPEFAALLRRATDSLSAVLPKNDDGSASLPVSLVARDAALSLHFDDLLEDGPQAREFLMDSLRLLDGYPPHIAQPARIVFNPSFGGLRGDVFHSTRVLIDFTVSPEEAAELPVFVPLNASGWPASSPLTEQPNASLHIVTRLDPAGGRFARLTNLDGHGLVLEGPREPGTDDLVRAWRSGNARDANGGFLLDLAQPEVIGSWSIAIEAARDAADGPPGFGFELDLAFQTRCRALPRRGDVLELGGEPYEVEADAAELDADGRVRGLRVTRLEAQPLGGAQTLLGLGQFLTPYRQTALLPACWLSFVPPPADAPATGVDSDAHVIVRFSEPMDPDSFRAFDTFRLLRGTDAGTAITAGDIVVGAVRAEASLQEFQLVPRLPLANVDERRYRFELVQGLAGVRDLSGTALGGAFGLAEFELGPGQPPRANGGFALRFASTDELLPSDRADVRGQITYEEDGGLLRPRPVAFASYTADRLKPVPSLMFPFAFGVQTPLSPLGSKLQALWRYCDFGWLVRDEAYHNLDVIGLSWSPLVGAVIADLYPGFEVRLAHSRYLPDESQGGGQPKYPGSGVGGIPFPFVTNLLDDPRGAQKTVNPRPLGYRLRPADLFLDAHGTPLVPFPWNRQGSELVSYTWRDTAVLARGGLGGAGIPLDIEVGAPLHLEQDAGSVALAGAVPSIGLPLLWEIRCYPSPSGIGLNSLDILLPVPGWPTPNFRAFSTGGIDTTGRPVVKDPDLEVVPSGGFNPGSTPPGNPTPLAADNSFYVGQIDTVVRVSRAHTIWIDTQASAPRYVEPVIEPRTQPDGTSIVVEYRGADGFSPEAGDAPFDAGQLDPYGDSPVGTTLFHGDGTWSADPHAADGARFLQVRFSFFNNVPGAVSPALDSFGIAFER